MKRRQGLKGKPGEFGTTGGSCGGSLIAQARNRAQRRVRSRGVYSHRGCFSHPRPQLALRAVREAHGTPALRNNQRWSVHQVRSRRCSGGVCRSSYRLTWEALGRANRMAPLVLTLSVDDRVSRVRGVWWCGRSQLQMPAALLDARKPEAYVLTFAWTASDRRSGYNPRAWRAAGPRDDLVRQHVNQVRENNGHHTEQATSSSITTSISRGRHDSSHIADAALPAHPGLSPHGFHALNAGTETGSDGNPALDSADLWFCSVSVTALSNVATATKATAAGGTNRTKQLLLVTIGNDAIQTPAADGVKTITAAGTTRCTVTTPGPAKCCALGFLYSTNQPGRSA